ncbi:M1 family metallopeptidase [Pedobacter sp. MC2016-14]|uniref:M1 family metallopeptidase n=1 Tax=Pedobacter sp. MC2016-14 TaxID=2897327 RepID=UPI001E493066|nr:M1 family metallopeptidase [Pedobacter sp. MC2016-14]MCD0490442.1 M1 family metallopeptidase [Pedobacter sp. MC2016-14]
MNKLLLFSITAVCSVNAFAQSLNNPGSNHGNKFEQLGTMISDPNSYRTASGAPGSAYWQQKADYIINADLNEKTNILTGSESITYYNNSPDPLSYLWVQLDENQHKSTDDSQIFDGSKLGDKMTAQALSKMIGGPNDLGVKIIKVTDAQGHTIPYTINQTMMRIDLPMILKPQSSYKLNISWNYKIPDRLTVGGRGGLEYFPEDDNYLYTITQWFPRMAVYSDFQGWQNKQFNGRGEFALVFGNYKVNMTVPADHVVGATGECQNYAQVLSSTALKRWNTAQTSKTPVEIVNLNEAKNAIAKKATGRKTWTYVASNVRDFAWVSSRRLVWDAMATFVDGKKIMAMSYYGPEAYPLYSKYSTKLISHTLKVYSKHTIPYPYPVAISVEAANGMEYPMICFNYGRAEKDGTYTEAIKNGMMGVIIHEVGHNFFPMIVNSDERQWSWMDEGLNTFCQFLAEQEWDNNYPSQRGPAHKITDYMKMPKDQLEPIMTNSENIINFGPNAYAKPATALNILRETIMGRELFDYAFKEYAKRWAFKHPTPADFFRTMEDASAVDLDWFWRGWFFGIDPVDISLDDLRAYRINSQNPALENIEDKKAYDRDKYIIGRERNKIAGIKFEVEQDTNTLDFYNKYNRFEVTKSSEEQFKKYYADLSPAERKLYDSKKNFYELDFSNKGGLVMPIIIQWTFTDGTTEVERIPAYVWRKDENKLTKVFAKDKEVASVLLDPYRETADIDEQNNSWPRKNQPSRFELFKQQQAPRGSSTGRNPMQEAKRGIN